MNNPDTVSELDVEDLSSMAPTAAEPDIYLTRCASCGGQFPTFRAICPECEDVAEADGYREGKKVFNLGAAAS